MKIFSCEEAQPRNSVFLSFFLVNHQDCLLNPGPAKHPQHWIVFARPILLFSGRRQQAAGPAGGYDPARMTFTLKSIPFSCDFLSRPSRSVERAWDAGVNRPVRARRFQGRSETKECDFRRPVEAAGFVFAISSMFRGIFPPESIFHKRPEQ